MSASSIRRLIRLTAADRVTLTSQRKDPNDLLLRRVLLKGDQLVYNTVTGMVNMDTPGSMIAEDYRKPMPLEKGNASDEARLERLLGCRVHGLHAGAGDQTGAALGRGGGR